MSQTNSLALSDHASSAQEARDAVQQLAAEVTAAEQGFKDLEVSLEAKAKELERTFPAYAGLFTDAAMSMTRLQQQLEELERQDQAAREARARAAGVGAGTPDMGDIGFDPDALPTTQKYRPNGSMKQLYKRIANHCHPDKTADPYLHELFERAQQAREAKDKDLMRDIMLEVELHLAGVDSDAARKIPNLMERLMERREYLNKQLHLWNARTSRLRSTPMGQVYVMSEHTSPAVREQGRSLFKTQLLKRISELENAATQLRQRLLARDVEPVV